jgi:hypothetical protein
MNTDRIKELEAMIKFGDELLKEYEQNNEEAPEFVYKKMILLHNELIELLKADTKTLNMITEAAKAANKVFENKRSLI